MVPEAYLKPCQTSMMELFSENSDFWKSYFHKKSPSKMFNKVISMSEFFIIFEDFIISNIMERSFFIGLLANLINCEKFLQ